MPKPKVSIRVLSAQPCSEALNRGIEALTADMANLGEDQAHSLIVRSLAEELQASIADESGLELSATLSTLLNQYAACMVRLVNQSRKYKQANTIQEET